MAKGYVVAHIRVHDKDGFEKFKEMAGPTISDYGGKVLVRNPSPEIREGSDSGVAIVIEFESIESARTFGWGSGSSTHVFTTTCECFMAEKSSQKMWCQSDI